MELQDPQSKLGIECEVKRYLQDVLGMPTGIAAWAHEKKAPNYLREIPDRIAMAYGLNRAA
jgi:hypothetical protein